MLKTYVPINITTNPITMKMSGIAGEEKLEIRAPTVIIGNIIVMIEKFKRFPFFLKGWGSLAPTIKRTIAEEKMLLLESGIDAFILKLNIPIKTTRGRPPAIPEKFENITINVYTTQPAVSRGRKGNMGLCLQRPLSLQNSKFEAQSSSSLHLELTLGYTSSA